MDNHDTRTFQLNDNDQPLANVLELEDKFEDPTHKDPRSIRDELGYLESGARANRNILQNVLETLGLFDVDADFCVDTKRDNFQVDFPESWVVTSDPSIQPPPIQEGSDLENYKWHKVEVCSPALYFDETSLAAVAQVHCGNSMHGFTQAAQQNLLATLLTFEPQIQKIHPLYRRSTPDYFYPYAPDLRNWSSLRNLPGLRTPTEAHSPQQKAEIEREFLTRALDAIFKANSLGALQKLADFKSQREGSAARMAYNIKNLFKASAGWLHVPNSKRTIEFRQHEGTMDPDRVINWIRFCVGLLEFADTVEQDTLKPFLEQHLELPDATGPAVLNMGETLYALGMYDIAGYYHNIVGVPDTAVKGNAADDLVDAMADAMM